jgi:DNA-binding NarL/FixJ family response regulator
MNTTCVTPIPVGRPRAVPAPAAPHLAPVPARATLRLLLADPDALFRRGVACALEQCPGLEVAAETGIAIGVAVLARRTRPDAVLLGLDPGSEATLVYLDRLRSSLRAVPVLVVVDPGRPVNVAELFDRGAAAVLLKTIAPEELAPAIEAVVGGVRRQVFGVRALEEPGHGLLTPREVQTLKAVGSGLSNRAIARELSVTEHTVKFHLTSVYRKLQLRSRAEAAHWAVENGVVARAFAGGA